MITTEQAFQMIQQALNVATQKGCYNLQDTANIIAALNVVGPLCETKQPTGEQPQKTNGK